MVSSVQLQSGGGTGEPGTDGPDTMKAILEFGSATTPTEVSIELSAHKGTAQLWIAADGTPSGSPFLTVTEGNSDSDDWTVPSGAETLHIVIEHTRTETEIAATALVAY